MDSSSISETYLMMDVDRNLSEARSVLSRTAADHVTYNPRKPMDPTNGTFCSHATSFLFLLGTISTISTVRIKQALKLPLQDVEVARIV